MLEHLDERVWHIYRVFVRGLSDILKININLVVYDSMSNTSGEARDCREARKLALSMTSNVWGC